MTDGANNTEGETVCDTDRAWARFEKLAIGEPVPAFWRQAEERLRSNGGNPARRESNSHSDDKDGIGKMKQTKTFERMPEMPGTPAIGAANAAGSVTAAGAANAAAPIGAGRSWRTEKPARRRLRRGAAVATAAAMAVVLFATPLGDRTLAAMQTTFHIQHMVGFGISADDMTAIADALERGSPEGNRSFNLAQYGSLTQTGGGKTRSLTWDEAERQMGGPLLRLDGAAATDYQPAMTLTFKLNAKAVNRLLIRLGGTTTLPAGADGQAIRLAIPDGVAAAGVLSGKPVKLLQIGKPELTVDGGIDPATVREAVLELPVLPDSLRAKLAGIGDWQSTLPVPARDGTAVNLRLGGRDAVMTTNGASRYLIWLDGQRMYLLSGERKDFPADSDFERAALELIRS